MENQLCFDPGTTPTPLSTYIQEHYEKLDLINSLPEMFVKINSEDVKHFGFDKVKEFCVSNSISENMVNSFQLFEPDKLSDQKRFQIGNDINSNLALSFDQFLKHSKGFDHLEKLKRVLHVLGKETLIAYLSKYMSCTYDPGILVSVLSVQDKQIQSQRNGGNDAPLGSAPGKTYMHGLIMESSKDICSLFDPYLPNHEASMYEITCRMFSTQLWSSSKKNQIKRSSYVTVMPFTNHVVFSSREFRTPEKLEMANLLSDEPATNSIIPKNTSFFLVWLAPSKLLYFVGCASYQATYRNLSFVGLVRHIKQQLEFGSIKRLSDPLVSPFNPSVLPFGEFISLKSN
uniref:Uncharacterized protein n=1 Tax=Brassica oleracea TaxID=3712 RepID=A0A3P6DU61_BRAOL|nr:unnamed protein product [Brassica oleracea]